MGEYPEAIHGVIITSVCAISFRLSAVVETTYLCNAKKPGQRDARELRETGKLTKMYLVELLSKLPKTKLSISIADDFPRLIRHLHTVFSIDEYTLC